MSSLAAYGCAPLHPRSRGAQLPRESEHTTRSSGPLSFPALAKDSKVLAEEATKRTPWQWVKMTLLLSSWLHSFLESSDEPVLAPVNAGRRHECV